MPSPAAGPGEGDPRRGRGDGRRRRTVLATIETEARAGEAHPDESADADGRRQSRGLRPRRCPPSFGGSPTSTSVDLMMVEGTGRRGRVTKKDILAFIEAQGAEKPQPTLHTESPYREEPGPPAAGDRRSAPSLSLMRKQIGEHMVRSLQTAAHCTTVVEADMTRDRGGARAAVVPAARGPGDDRRAARAPAAQRDDGGRPAHAARRGAPRHRGRAGRRRADRAGGAQRARAVARGARRADHGPGRAGAQQAPGARRGAAAARSRSPTPGATARCWPRRSSTSRRWRSSTSRPWSSGRSWSATSRGGIASPSGR